MDFMLDDLFGEEPPPWREVGQKAQSTDPVAPPEAIYWAVQLQTINVARLDQYLASVSDQEDALRDSEHFAGRLVLRSQPRPDKFWLLDAWLDQYAMESASIALRTLSSVAGLAEEPREIPTVQVLVGSAGLRLPGGSSRGADDPLPFFMVSENRVKPVVVGDYLESQETFTRDIEDHDGFGRRLLLRDVRDSAHFLVIDEWASEKAAFEAFESRQTSVSEITMTRFLALLSERGERDFALGLHA